ncbi:MAG: hypothetical protein M1839_000363 [Geoglossum umbratile]|nr:MAG: hypothetical protein M1839_000363 [Geoglossum umbratile]
MASTLSAGFRGDEDTILSIKSSLQNWFQKKYKRTSPYPPRPATLRPRRPTEKPRESEAHVVTDFRFPKESQLGVILRFPPLVEESSIVRHPQDVHRDIFNLPTDQVQGPQQPECGPGLTSTRRASLPGRRRSSAALARPRRILPPQDFAPKDFQGPPALSRPRCPNRGCRISQPYLLWPGWRVTTQSRSPESCFITSIPLYSARFHSPLDTDRPFTVYFEAAIRLGNGNDEDGVCLALGFVAGRDRACRMPGFEQGSIGIHCRDRQLYLNNCPVENTGSAPFEPGQHLGIGMTFSRRDGETQQVDDAHAQLPLASSSSINVEVFLSRDRKKAGCWNLKDFLGKLDGLPLEGLEGNHDLYAAVGTVGKADVDIYFNCEDWRARDKSER